MNLSLSRSSRTWLWLSLFLCLGLPLTASAAEEASPTADSETEADDDKRELEGVVVTGTRKIGLMPNETLSPIDVLDSDALLNQANFDLTDNFTRIAPSFNTQRFPIADGTAFVRPVTLRNLSPDHTLVLIDGTRRHRSALVNLQLAPLGTVNQGSQGVDFQTIPSLAVERIEVLRDGASAQYGSDAIAGVVNIILKQAQEGGSAYGQTGEYAEGDGQRVAAGVNFGMYLGDDGYFNSTFEYASSDTTDRGVARPDAQQVANVVGADLVPINGKGQRWGDPDVEAKKLFFNFGKPMGSVDFYGNASYSEINTISDFFYRGPVLPPAEMFDARTTLQIDTNGDYLPDEAPQQLVDDINNAGLNPDDYLTADAGSASGYVLLNPIYTLFPGGYNPDFGADITDLAMVVGFEGEMANGWKWDTTGRVASNEVEYVLSETINPSLGRLSPTSFRPGTLTQDESSINVDFVKSYEIESLHSPLNFAVGVEWRNETYEITPGDAASRAVGPTASYFGLGSDGFQGFSTEAAGKFSSDSIATYLDLEAGFTEKFSGGAAFRFEDYDTFGSTFDWKLSGRYDVTDRFAIRATANTGFRAPTPGQINTLNVTTSADASGNLVPSGTYPVNHPIARALGATDLEPEESTNLTFGIVYEFSNRTYFTADYYDIQIENRLALRNITIGPAEVTALTNAGIANAATLQGSLVNYFTNSFDSNVRGVDVAVTTGWDALGGSMELDFRHNYNEMEVSSVAPNTINQSRVFDIENQVPNNRSTITWNYATTRFMGLVRANYYGDWDSTGGLFSPGDASDASNYSAETLFDVEATYTFSDTYDVTLGIENVLDTYPDEEQDPVLQFLGVKYSLTSPFGFNGRFTYLRLTGRF